MTVHRSVYASPVTVLASDVLYCKEAVPRLATAAWACMNAWDLAHNRVCGPGRPSERFTAAGPLFLLCNVPRCRVTVEDIFTAFGSHGLAPVPVRQWLPGGGGEEGVVFDPTAVLSSTLRADTHSVGVCVLGFKMSF